jgi:hypothetical protein
MLLGPPSSGTTARWLVYARGSNRLRSSESSLWLTDAFTAEKEGTNVTTAIAHTFKPTRSRVLTVVTILFGCYGLLSAQQARSATTLAKQVWGGIRANGTIAHQKHITSVVKSGVGGYTINFDRHVDNCSLQATARDEGGSVAITGAGFAIFPGSSTKQVSVAESNGAATELGDGDFDIFGMCPST